MTQSEIVFDELKPTDKPTQKQLDEVANAAKFKPDTSDIPEISDEVLMQIAQNAKSLRALNTKEVVSLRLSKKTVIKARSLGKGYTSILSQILDNVLNNEELLKSCLR